MPTQFDHSVRVVSLDNLRAMCERVSGMAHRFDVVKVSRSRVHVEYSNPDEYGRARPVTAIYPCYPSSFDSTNDNPAIVLDMLRCFDPEKIWDGDAWQCFELLHECPTLWRSPAQLCSRPIGHVLNNGTCSECKPETWSTHGDVLMRIPHMGLEINPADDVEWCRSAHGKHCDAPARAAQALVVFTRALAGYCACNNMLRARGRHEESCIEFRSAR